VLLWRGRARYHPHFTDMQEPSGIERTTTLQEKLYGPVDALQKTTRFIAETEIKNYEVDSSQIGANYVFCCRSLFTDELYT